MAAAVFAGRIRGAARPDERCVQRRGGRRVWAGRPEHGGQQAGSGVHRLCDWGLFRCAGRAAVSRAAVPRGRGRHAGGRSGSGADLPVLEAALCRGSKCGGKACAAGWTPDDGGGGDGEGISRSEHGIVSRGVFAVGDDRAHREHSAERIQQADESQSAALCATEARRDEAAGERNPGSGVAPTGR